MTSDKRPQISDILTEAEMEQPRTPSDLHRWALEVHDRFADPSYVSFARMGRGLAKPFYDELMPLAHLVLSMYGEIPYVLCTPTVLSGENHDAIVVDSRDEQPQTCYCEITRAVDGRDEHLRMHCLEQHGSVPAHGSLNTTGNKHRGYSFNPERELRNMDTAQQTCLEQIRSAVVNKADRPYGPDHILGVSFDDRLQYHFPNRRAAFASAVSQVLSDLQLDFGTVYLVGISGEWCPLIIGTP